MYPEFSFSNVSQLRYSSDFWKSVCAFLCGRPCSCQMYRLPHTISAVNPLPSHVTSDSERQILSSEKGICLFIATTDSWYAHVLKKVVIYSWLSTAVHTDPVKQNNMKCAWNVCIHNRKILSFCTMWYDGALSLPLWNVILDSSCVDLPVCLKTYAHNSIHSNFHLPI